MVRKKGEIDQLSGREGTKKRRSPPNPVAVVAAAILALLLVAIVLPTLIDRGDPLELSVRDRLQPPSMVHWLGTDEAGRDLYSRIVHGARYSVGMSLAVVIFATAIGTLWGCIAGFVGGRLDDLMMRVVDIFLAFPFFVLALSLASAMGRNMTSAVITLVLVWWPGYARMIRGQVLSIRENLYVEAARSIGVREHAIILKHILPQTTNELGVRMTLDIGYVILALTGLSFLGLGAQHPIPEWGLMVSDSRQFVFRAWWYAFFPGLMIFVTVVAFVFMGNFITRMRDRGGRLA
jgi:peptide/nickel transport system permease protein